MRFPVSKETGLLVLADPFVAGATPTCALWTRSASTRRVPTLPFQGRQDRAEIRFVSAFLGYLSYITHSTRPC
ncbi:hypothetical protein NEOLEDRAFT_1131573 [Neolentinus lepideus HHB14362 ss-1]|uniref:Uncharacterized protein n=1 Tax=Neolentinus lepideus HHB14362 ss-1 TaxID=1314782 RepID=A0A165TR49_9AGAM|nr:hypothetical protein NEOLEDRAFT_1131573 [Neolentinus lepideus HHB14362 ss-1]